LRDDDGDGFADESILYHVGMDRPHGIIWDDDKLYVAEPSQLLELRDTNHDNQVDQVRVIVGGLPDDGGHWARSIVQGNDGFIYLAVGSRCNACEEKHPQRATVLKVNPVTGKTVIFARGLRNTIGLAFAPDGDILWGTDIGRTGLRGQLPPDEINQISVAGDYGWPFCYGQQLVDPAFVAADRCANTVASSIDLAAGSGPMGITFGAGLNAPEPYRNSLYVALHGSADDGSVTSGKLIRIPYQEQNIDRHGEEFLRGLQVTGNSWWTPVAVIVGIDGHLYVSDDQAQAIYRIRWQQAE
ncbi:MAG: PQQ-dependent sugar dehydrogenase, partial [Thermodesulfobacteriota bacterium]|nr:PQQ-dependent sugar dehydrogenase [Thermodesulfobacteriota bacterium]